MNSILRNPRTTLVALLGAIVILLNQLVAVVDSDPETVFSLDAVINALAVLGIGLFARDSNVTSEQAGAKR